MIGRVKHCGFLLINLLVSYFFRKFGNIFYCNSFYNHTVDSLPMLGSLNTIHLKSISYKSFISFVFVCLYFCMEFPWVFNFILNKRKSKNLIHYNNNNKKRDKISIAILNRIVIVREKFAWKYWQDWAIFMISFWIQSYQSKFWNCNCSFKLKQNQFT